MILNTDTTLFSLPPDNSKWWWSGAILKILFPVLLKCATWIITDNVSSIGIIAIIPIIETLSVMLQVFHFKRTGERIFKMAPIHHHFELSGWKENKVVSVFSLVTLLACIVGLISI